MMPTLAGHRISRCLLAAFFLIAMFASGPVVAREAVRQPTSAGETIRLVRALVAVGEVEEARRVNARWKPDAPDFQVRAAFVEGLIAARSGDHAQAVVLYRAILRDLPGLTAVRLELAKSLYALGDDDAARYQAETLIAAGVDDRLEATLGTILLALDQRRPVQFRGEFGILPSTNINSGTDRRTVRLGNLTGIIDPQVRRRSGIGVRAGGQVVLQRPISDSLTAIGTATVTGRYYPSISELRSEAGVSVGMQRRTAASRMLLSAIGGGEGIDEEAVLWYAGLAGEGLFLPLDGTRLVLASSIRREQVIVDNRRDGWILDLSGNVDRFLAPNRFVRLLFGATADRRDVERFSYDEGRIGIGVYNEFPLGISVYAQGMAARRRYRDLFPGLAEEREDTRLSASLIVTKRDVALLGFAPQAAYRFERNVSNDAFSDRTAHEFELRLTKDF